MAKYIDFNALKSEVSIEQVVSLLGLKAAKSGNQLRAPCPTCKTGGDRALAITPSKNLFYCFAAQSGGDQIQLAAHIRNETVKDAASFLAGTLQDTGTSTGTGTGTVSKNHAKEGPGFQPLDYLEAEHPAVEAVGFEPETAQALGIGYAGKGIMRGTVAVPIRLTDGTLAGYIGITEAKLPTRFHLIPTNVLPFQRKAG